MATGWLVSRVLPILAYFLSLKVKSSLTSDRRNEFCFFPLCWPVLCQLSIWSHSVFVDGGEPQRQALHTVVWTLKPAWQSQYLHWLWKEWQWPTIPGRTSRISTHANSAQDRDGTSRQNKQTKNYFVQIQLGEPISWLEWLQEDRSLTGNYIRKFIWEVLLYM